MNNDLNEYLKEKCNEIRDLQNETKLSNYYYQASAKKIGAVNDYHYSEKYMWRNALAMASIGSRILEHDPDNLDAIKAVHFSAKIYEVLSDTSSQYDKDYCKVLASLCYDISGYHANALCLIKEIYILNPEHSLENIFLNYIQIFMQRRLRKLYDLTINSTNRGLIGEINKVFFLISDFFLHGSKFNEEVDLNKFDNQVIEEINKLYSMFSKNGNVLLSHFTVLFRTKYIQLTNRSIWHILYKYQKTNNKYWNRYARILANNIYSDGKIIKEQERISIIEFWKSQLNALDKGIINTKDNYIIQMPTSAGKTFIAEMIILFNLIECPGKKCIYIAPFKALVNQVEEALSDHLGKMGYVVSTIVGSYEVDTLDNLLINEADVLVATPEKIDLLLRLMPDFFLNVSNVTFDEGHVLGNMDNRSSLMEFLITRIKNKLKENVSFNFISAVMPDISVDQISKWLLINENNKINSKEKSGEKWQPTRRLTGKFEWHNNSGWILYPDLLVAEKRAAMVPHIINVNEFNFRNQVTNRNNKVVYPKTSSKSETASALAHVYKEVGPVLIFCGQPQFANSVAEAYIRLLDLNGNNDNKYNMDSIEVAKEVLGEESKLVKYLEYGIGLHTGSIPQILRRTIENDYKKGKLKLLIATNTLGQGVNLPIKTIIIHSVNISEKSYISNRDFWNIVGRAGRAGRETEGNVIYICNSDYDNKLCANYLDESKTEQVDSVFYLITKLICERRIESKELPELLEKYIEPQLFAMLVEELVDTSDEDIIRNLIGNTLFKIQIDTNEKLEDTDLVNQLVIIAQRFFITAPNKEKQKVFSGTAFSLRSCIFVYDFIQREFDLLYKNAEQNPVQFIVSVLLSLREVSEMQIDKKKINEILSQNEILVPLTEMWLDDNKDISDIRSFMESNDLDAYNLLNEFIETMFSYRYSWGVTSFIVIFKYVIEEKEYDNIIDLDNFSSFIKYGTSHVYTSWANSIGVPTRKAANIIGNYFEDAINKKDIKEFVKWFSDLSREELNNIFNKNDTFEIKYILNIAQKMNTSNFVNLFDDEEFVFYVMGIKYNEESIEIARTVALNDVIWLERDLANEYDNNAIKIMMKDGFLGYVPREIAKVISIQIDFYNKRYKGYIRKIKITKGYSIKVNVFEF